MTACYRLLPLHLLGKLCPSRADFHTLLDYDLVRSHHPDTPHCRSLPTDLAHSRFQAITKAYDILRNPHLHSNRHPSSRHSPYYSSHPRSNQHAYRHHYSYYMHDQDVWVDEMNKRRAELKQRQETWGRSGNANGKNAKGLDGMKDPIVVIVGLSVRSTSPFSVLSLHCACLTRRFRFSS